MSRAHSENTTTFAEVFTTTGIAYQQNRSIGSNDNRLMLYFQGGENLCSGWMQTGNASDYTSGNQAIMIKRFTQDAKRIFLACGATDFRKQIPGLVAMVQMQFHLAPYETQYVFIFCN